MRKTAHENDNQNKRGRTQHQDSHDSKAPSDQTDPRGFNISQWTDAYICPEL